LKNVVTSSTVQIMPSSGGYSSLIFSSDGNYLYFGTNNGITGIIVRIPVFGGTPREVAKGHGGHFAVSPDGKQLAFPRISTEPEESQSLIVVDTETGEEKVVVKRPDSEKDKFYFHGWGATPSWSPDGSKIAICGGKRDEKGEWHQVVFEVRAGDGAMSEIPAPRWAGTYQVAWLADGASLLVVAREKATAPYQIWHLAYPSGEASRVTNDLHDYGKLSLTADSRTLVATQETQTSNIWILPDGDTNRAQQLTFGTSIDNGYYGMAWTPDGRIVFASNRNGAVQQLWTMNADGGNLQQLTTESSSSNHSPKVSPDGRYIVFVSVSTQTGKPSIWRMDIDGRNAVKLTDGTNDNRPTISSDGRWIYYTSEGDAPSSIAKVSIDGGEPVKLTSRFNAYAPVVSPDGKFISYIHFEDAVGWRRGVIHSEGGEPFKLLQTKDTGKMVWTPDSKGLIYIKGVTLSSNLFRQSIEGDAAPEQITHFKEDRIFSLAYSPDFKQLVITRGNHYSDIVLINNFR
nr:DPP IV N-terminal domain-containing protein [Acidobacteriota bacterium]